MINAFKYLCLRMANVKNHKYNCVCFYVYFFYNKRHDLIIDTLCVKNANVPLLSLILVFAQIFETLIE